MTGFTLVYEDDHEYNEGIIEISNTTSNLKMAYLAISSSVSNALSAPILRGFLYQVQVDGKRSRPYPIVSDRQTIRLDMAECEKFLFVPSNRIINGYSIALYVSTESGGGESVDLTAYVLETELPDFDSFVTEEALVTALSDYALLSKLPDVSNYVTGSTVTALLVDSLSDLITEGQLNTILNDYVLTADLTSSSSASQNLIATSINTTLESGKGYQSTEPDLAFTLPSVPSIADVIELATGNHSLLVKHGDAFQTVLNSNTYTVAGISNGIMLKPYSSIKLRYVGSNLWVAFNKTRIVNNFTPITQESTPTKKNYTATAPVAAYGAIISGIWNGIKGTGALTNGYLSDTTTGDILVTVSEPILLNQIRLCNGQANVGYGINDPYSVRDIKIYAGSTDTAEYLGVYTFANTSSAEENKAITENTAPSNTFLFRVNSVTPRTIGILELEIWGKGATGGEVSVS